jgi:DNA-binding NarL/FixJ family response regulator
MAGRIRLLVADDHPMLREGLVAVLGTQPDFEVVGEAADGDEVVRLAESLGPDVILLDLEMPGTDGVAALERLREAGSTARTVVFTAYDTDERILGSLRAGTRGYLLKGASRQEIFGAIRTVHAGGSLMQPAVTDRLLERIDRGGGPDTRTVKFHVGSILAKLGADNRTEAVTIAANRGLVRLTD